MKGIIEKNSRGWIVKEIVGEGPDARLIKTYPLHPINVKNLEPSVLGEYGEVMFDIVKEYSDNKSNQLQEYAKLATPMLDRLRSHLDSITPEQFNQEIEDIIKNDTSTYKIHECCGMEECDCDRKSAIDFARWLAKDWMSIWVVDKWLWEYQGKINKGNKCLLGYKTEVELYELYLITMMNNQTAIGWLEQEFIKLESTTGVYGIMYELIEKAKYIEQIKHEISDDEIKRQSWIYDPRKKMDIEFIRAAFVAGAKWYRDQITKK